MYRSLGLWGSILSISASATLAGQPRLDGPEFQANTYTTNSQRRPAVAIDGQGNFVVVWGGAGTGDSDGIFAQRHDAAGGPRGPEFRVNTYTTSTQNYPSVSADGAGGFVVAWQSLNQDGSGQGVFAQRYDSAGTKLMQDSDGDGTPESEFQVNTYTTSHQRAPSVAKDGSGGFVVAWQSYGQDGSGHGIFAQRYDSAGAAIGSEFQVNTYTTSAQVYPSVSADGSGGFVVAWNGEDGSGHGIFAQRYDSAGAAIGSEFQVNTYTTNVQIRPSVSADGSGGFVVAWQSFIQDLSNYGVFAQRYDSTGAAAGVEFQVNTFTLGAQKYPSVSVDGAGGFVVAWESLSQDGSSYGVFAQRYDSAGVAVGSEFQVNTYTTTDQRYPSVAMDAGGQFVVAWQGNGQDGSGDGIFAQRLDPAGSPPQGSEFQANAFTFNPQRLSSVARNASGEFVVVWGGYFVIDSWDIFGARFDSAGNALIQDYDADGSDEAEFLVNTYTTGAQGFGYPSFRPGVAMDDTGAFVVVWTSFDQDDPGSGYGGVFAQRFGSDGFAAGAEFQVNTYTTSGQGQPVVASDRSTGDFVVVWVSYDQAGVSSGYDLFGQRYDSAGTPVGGEFAVNTHTTAGQATPAVSMKGGEFVVTWTSENQGGAAYGYDIFARRYDSAGTPAGAEFRVNTETLLNQDYSSISMAADGGFVVTWHDNAAGSTNVRARRFDAAGSAAGPEFQVSTNTTYNNLYPVVSVENDGGFVVAWSSFYDEGDGGDSRTWGVFARRYDSAGSPLDTDGDGSTDDSFQVNSYTSGHQLFPDVAGDGSGNFVVTWQSPQDGDEIGVFGQRFNADGCPVPLIVNDPAGQSVCEGVAVSFTVGVGGTPPHTFQWRKDGIDLTDGGSIQGATTATLTIDPVALSDAGSYDCVVTDACGVPLTATSAAATLTVETTDGDADGTIDEACGGTDCDDTIATCAADCTTDADADGTIDCADGCLDGDGDGYGLAGGAAVSTCSGADCNDGDASAWAVPGEVGTVTWQGTGTTVLEWLPPSFPGGTTPLYDTVRSTDPADFATTAITACIESDDGSDTQATDGAVPVAGFYYLIRAGNSCGEGTSGTWSDGVTLRTVKSCP